jgi:hypothetical protein
MRLRRRLQLACVLASGMVGLSAGEARADALPMTSNVVTPNNNSIGLQFSVDGTLNVDAAYARRFRNVFGRRYYPLQLEARLSVPLSLIPDYGGIRLGGAASALFTAKNGWGILFGLGPDALFSRNAHSSQFAFGAEGFVRPGYWMNNGLLALDLGYRLGYATCIIHRAPTDALFGDRYPGASTGPREGCLPLAAQRFRAGLMFAITSMTAGFGGVHLAGGVQYTPQIEGVFSSYPMTALPFYVQLGASMVFR